MTSKQRIALMATWWPDACEANGWNKNDRERRLEVLGDALGRIITSANEIETNEDVDAVKAYLLAISQPANVTAQVKIANMPHTRLVYSIRSFGLGEAYIRAISLDRFGTEDWETLPEHRLEQLRNTLSNRARAHKAKLQTVPADEPF